MDFKPWTYRLLRSFMYELEHMASECEEGSKEHEFLMSIYKKINSEVFGDEDEI